MAEERHPRVAWHLHDVAGTNTITGSTDQAYKAYRDRLEVRWRPTSFRNYFAGMAITWVAAGTNTGAATLNVNGRGAKTLLKTGAALASGDLVSGNLYSAVYDGTSFQMVGGTAGAAGSGSITASGYTMSTNRLLGRTTAGTGAIEEITPVANTGLLFSATNLNLDRALQSDMETPTSGNKIVASTVVLYHPGVVKAFCRFDSTGSVSGPTYNIASITDHGTGDWTVGISGSFPLSSANGTILLSVENSTPLVAVVNARTSASAYRIRCYDFLGILTDPAFIDFAILGDCT